MNESKVEGPYTLENILWALPKALVASLALFLFVGCFFSLIAKSEAEKITSQNAEVVKAYIDWGSSSFDPSTDMHGTLVMYLRNGETKRVLILKGYERSCKSSNGECVNQFRKALMEIDQGIRGTNPKLKVSNDGKITNFN